MRKLTCGHMKVMSLDSIHHGLPTFSSSCIIIIDHFFLTIILSHSCLLSIVTHLPFPFLSCFYALWPISLSCFVSALCYHLKSFKWHDLAWSLAHYQLTHRSLDFFLSDWPIDYCTSICSLLYYTSKSLIRRDEINDNLWEKSLRMPKLLFYALALDLYMEIIYEIRTPYPSNYSNDINVAVPAT